MMKTIILIFSCLCLLTFKSEAQTVTDIEGNVYNTIAIGTQVWMKENLKTTKYNNNTAIPNNPDSSTWDALLTGAYCNYNNDSTKGTTYGRLYNWYAITDTRGLCPTGWHIPSDTEWTTLTNFLGGISVAGGKMKEIGTTHWSLPNTSATNSSNFTALPSGYRNSSNGSFTGIGYFGDWWTATSHDNASAWARNLSYANATVVTPISPKNVGYSARCIKNMATNTSEINDNYKIKLYPNPAHDILVLETTSTIFSSVKIYNVLGVCVLQFTVTNQTNTIDIRSLSKGIYIVKFTGANGEIQQKFIKE